MDKTLASLVAHAAMYANHDNPAARLRYRFLMALCDDPIFPIKQPEFEHVQRLIWMITDYELDDIG